jgi:hypothetical protein
MSCRGPDFRPWRRNARTKRAGTARRSRCAAESAARPYREDDEIKAGADGASGDGGALAKGVARPNGAVQQQHVAERRSEAGCLHHHIAVVAVGDGVDAVKPRPALIP